MKKKDEELISIVIPVFNTQKYIMRCIKSILKQDYQNYEVILVNDGSDEECTALLNEIERIDNRIILLNQKNMGVSKARNTGIEYSKGSWITFVDSDDYIDSSFLTRMINVALETSSDIVAAEYYTCKSDEIIPFKFLNDNEIRSFVGDDRLKIIKSCIDSRAYGNTKGPTNIGVPWAKVYRREIILGEEFDNKLTHMEDAIFNINVMMRAKRITYLPLPLYYYVVHSDSTVHSSNKHFEPIAQRVTERLLEFSQKYHLERELQDTINYKQFSLYYICVNYQYFRSADDTPSNVIKNLRRISKTYTWDGKYQVGLTNMYTKAQLLYGILVRLNLFGMLYLALLFAKRCRNS